MLCSSSWESKTKAITVRNQLFFPIIYYCIIHQDFTISYGNAGNYTDAVVAYAESKTFWIKHFEVYSITSATFGGTMKGRIWKWELSFCIYFIFTIVQMLLEALNLRLAINILPDWISAWQLVSFRSQWQRKLW